MIRHLDVRLFRNLAPTRWQLGAGRHLLQGGTGQGKTALLEAIYVALTTRSFRTRHLSECLSHEASADAGFSTRAEIENGVRVTLEVGWSRAGARRERNGQHGPLVEHVGAQPVLAWTRIEAETWTGAPSLRRRFLDRGLVGRDPQHLTHLLDYRRLLAQKRALLRAASPRAHEIEPWNLLLSEAMSAVIGARRRYAAELQKTLEVTTDRAALEIRDLDLRYRPASAEGDDRAAALAQLEAALPREIELGRPQIGPHLDRIELSWRGREIAAVASAGERKAIGLLVLLAQRELMQEAGRDPVLLIDDVDIELDRRLFVALWRLLSAVPQTIVSSNRPEVFQGLEVERRTELENGQVLDR